jgi:hypothetical protein
MRLKRNNYLRSRTMGPSVLIRSDSSSGGRSAQSELDRRAIRMVRHPLTTGSWLEHQLGNTPTPLTSLVGKSGWVRSPLRRIRSVDSQFTQPTGKQPSHTADLAVISG